jgi:hypothetical protein
MFYAYHWDALQTELLGSFKTSYSRPDPAVLVNNDRIDATEGQDRVPTLARRQP